MTTEVLGELDPDEGTGGLDPRERYRRQSAAAAVAALRAEAARLKGRELEAAFERLEARGDLGDAERDALEELADAIVEGVLAAPIGHLGRPARPVTCRTALRLFDLERDSFDRRRPTGAGPLSEVADGE